MFCLIQIAANHRKHEFVFRNLHEVVSFKYPIFVVSGFSFDYQNQMLRRLKTRKISSPYSQLYSDAAQRW